MGPRQRILAAALAVCALLLLISAAPSRAFASTTEQSILMDDDQLIYSSPSHVARVMEQLHGLGVDTVKVSVAWALVAPSPRPRGFDASDPRSYPPGSWDRYDLIDRLATALGMHAYFQLTPPSPSWAIIRDLPTGQGIPLGQAPSPRLFGQFATAVARRYNGSFVPATDAPATPAARPTILGLPVPAQSTPTQTAAATAPALPAVRMWSVWNEPNFPSWLNPATREVRGSGRQYVQPLIYRELVDAAWSALQANGHAGDTVLLGELAPFGSISPIPFIEDLYCLSAHLHALSGYSAAHAGCPSHGDLRAFRAAHPALFEATGLAYHPYSFDVAPDRPYPSAGWFTLQNLGGLESGIDQVLAVYGVHHRGGLPMYLSEWGYKTNPPNPYVHTTLTEQADWLNEGEFMTWGIPYVQALAQFLLVDDAPRTSEPVGSRLYWHTFQTGLEMQSGRPKPSLAAFRMPIWVPHPHHGSVIGVWGQLRPADHSTRQTGVVEFRRPGSSRWMIVRSARTANPEGFIVIHVVLPGPGAVRLAWVQPGTGTEYDSRSVSIS